MQATQSQTGTLRRAAWLLAGAVVLAGGCSASSSRNPFHDSGPSALSVLEVDNRYWADMTISVRRGGQLVRLGQVTTNSRQRFQIPLQAGGPGTSVQFIADPVGSGTVYESPIVALGAGEGYLWTLAVNIQHSTLVRR